MCIRLEEEKKRIPLVVLMMFIDVFRWKFHFSKFFLDTQKAPLQRPPRRAGAHDSLVTSIIHMYIIKKVGVLGSCFSERKVKTQEKF